MARKILLADDSVTAQNMGRKILTDAGYDVATVNNGSAALKRVSEQRPDLIVLDVYMPGYSGLEVCQRLKDSPETAGIPILLTVGKLEPFKPEEARRVRAEAYIVKPFEASELLSALTRLEDQVVPGGKNGKSDSHGDTETGWKNRLRFPSRKKKEEPEPEPDIDFTAGTVAARGSRRGRSSASDAAAKEKPIPEIPRDITPEELDALSALAAKLDGESAKPKDAAPVEQAVASEAREEFKVAPPAQEEKTAAAAAAEVEAPSSPAPDAPAAEVPASLPVAEVAEPKPAEPVPVNVAALAEREPAPVDQQDEPIFSTAPPSADAVAEERVESKEAAPAPAEPTPVASVTEAETPAKIEEAKAAESPAAVVPAVPEVAAEAPKVETPESVARPAESAEQAAPTEEELAEALRLLTPSTAEAAAAAPTAVIAHDAARSNAVPSQWAAVAVALAPGEASCSLEAEMFKTQAAAAAVSSTPEVSAPVESKGIAMAAAAAESGARSAQAISAPAAKAPEAAAPAPIVADSREQIADAAPADEPVAATFADTVRKADEDLPSVSAAAETATASTSDAAPGGEEDMGKKSGKSGKSTWRDIRPATPAASDAVEAAKQAVVEETQKAMAAAADSVRSSAADANAIANIVDSVLADLRPKIVEEISKKLSGK